MLRFIVKFILNRNKKVYLLYCRLINDVFGVIVRRNLE